MTHNIVKLFRSKLTKCNLIIIIIIILVRKLTNFYCNFLIFSIRIFVFSLAHFTVVTFDRIKISNIVYIILQFFYLP